MGQKCPGEVQSTQTITQCLCPLRSCLPSASTKGLLFEVVGTEVTSWPRSAERGGESLPLEKPSQGQHE